LSKTDLSRCIGSVFSELNSDGQHDNAGEFFASEPLKMYASKGPLTGAEGLAARLF
jgi:hypothetical protein